MNGRIITLLRKKQFDYSFLAASTSQTITLHRAIQVLQFNHYWLDVRVHNSQISSGTFNFEAFSTLPSSDDAREFSEIGSSLMVEVGSGISAPALVTEYATNLGPYLKFAVTCAQGGGAGRLYAEVSAALTVRAR